MRSRSLLVLAMTLACAAPVVQPAAATVCGVASAPIDLSTGATHGLGYPAGTPDPRWILVSSPANPVPSLPGPAFTDAPEPRWVNVPGAMWINPAVGGDGSANLPVGVYDYTTVFAVPPGTTAALLDIVYASDDDVQFFLNGSFVGGHVPVPPNLADTHTMTWRLTLSPASSTVGPNIFEARVNNTGGGPSGLSISGAVYVC